VDSVSKRGKVARGFVGDESDNGAQLSVDGVANLPEVFYLCAFYVAPLLPGGMAVW
jgi:hypothetical protein